VPAGYTRTVSHGLGIAARGSARTPESAQGEAHEDRHTDVMGRPYIQALVIQVSSVASTAVTTTRVKIANVFGVTAAGPADEKPADRRKDRDLQSAL
jgi:hypothetical protein